MSKEAKKWLSQFDNYDSLCSDVDSPFKSLEEMLQAYADEQDKALIEKIEELKWDEVSFVGAAYNSALNDVIRHFKQLEK